MSPAATPASRVSSIARVLGLARPEVWSLIAGSVFLAIGSIATLLFPRAIGQIVDRATGDGLGDLDRTALWLLAIAAVQAVAGALRYALFTTAGERVVTRLRADLFARLMDQDIAFFDRRRRASSPTASPPTPPSCKTR